MSRIIVAIDGPSGAGKSTIAKRVADEIGATLLDTGALYRSLALQAQREGIDWNAEVPLAELANRLVVTFEIIDGENHVFVAGNNESVAIRTPEISKGASLVSRHPMVRTALLHMQRDFAKTTHVVAEGRDTTTVVFPHAQVKIFLTADLAVRARRRTDELLAAGQSANYDEVLAAEQARDEADSARAVAPLVKAPDAIAIDTTAMTIDEVVRAIVSECRKITSNS